MGGLNFQGGIVGQILASRITCRQSAPSHIAVLREDGIRDAFSQAIDLVHL